jgi:hypothetical protein
MLFGVARTRDIAGKIRQYNSSAAQSLHLRPARSG